MISRKDKFQTIDEYIKAFPEDMQKILRKIRETIKETAPGAEETISYQIPTFKLNGNLVHFAGYKNHIGFYPAPSGTEAFKKEIAVYRSGKGSIQFPLNRPIPLSLIKKIVKYRVKENLAKTKPKKIKR
ncbi:MAG TPA: DUF1801 domain-containing protein [Ignavibacteriaceae bacterium]|nr:DUF1801 domain-containing protein [Ignavibacteriaceae bacterium]